MAKKTTANKTVSNNNTVNNNAKVNVGSLTPTFAQFDTIDMVKAVFDAIVSEAKRAAEERAKQLMAAAKPQPAAPAVVVTMAKEPEPTPTAKTKSEKAAKAEKTAKAEKADEVLVSLTDKKAVKKLGLHFVAYKNSQLIVGDTKPIRKELKKLINKEFGVYCFNNCPAVEGKFDGGFVWAVNNKTAAKVAKLLGVKYVAKAV